MFRSKLLVLLALSLLMLMPVGLVHAQDGVAAGTAVIWDDMSLSDAITYSMTDVPAPAVGREYVGWLISDDGSIKLNTGPMTVGTDGSIAHTFDSSNSRHTGDNLILGYDKVVITDEAAGDDPDAPAGPAVFHHVVPSGAMAHIRHLLATWPPDADKGILTNLREQLDVAILHATLAQGSDSIENIRLHAHHVINIIEGADGANYDVSFGDPGDGLGVLLHADDRKHGRSLPEPLPATKQLSPAQPSLTPREGMHRTGPLWRVTLLSTSWRRIAYSSPRYSWDPAETR